MPDYQREELSFYLEVKGSDTYRKTSYPLHQGVYFEIQTPQHTFFLNRNHQIRFIESRSENWPNPQEWLKRTLANDWIYYSNGGYSGVFEAVGEYYLPVPEYPTNSIKQVNPFEHPAIQQALAAFPKLLKQLAEIARSETSDLSRFCQKAACNTPQQLAREAARFYQICSGPISVLPPDTRHVDYNIIPLMISDGCLYRCGFCTIKTGKAFAVRSKENILAQLKQLKEHFQADLQNYNAVFLGNHDALAAPADTILFAAEKAYSGLEIENSYLKGAHLYLFGSVDALLSAEDRLFQALQQFPYQTFINIGTESADAATLKAIRKPLTAQKVKAAFQKLIAVNRLYSKIEISANIVLAENLPKTHLLAYFDLLQTILERPYSKGSVYFSPLFSKEFTVPENIMREFYKIKTQSRLPCYLYLIQRL